MISSSDRDRLRRELRARRRALSSKERAHAAARFAAVAQQALLLRPHLRVAFYIAYGAEADPSALLQLARKAHCTVYLPIITNHRHHRMSFAPFDASDVLVPNRYGIPEPVARRAETIPVRMLDLIVLPVIAVDAHGWRLGSGAGFYDRSLHHLRAGRRWRRPKLVGLAYELQRIESLKPQPWDVPVDAVLTERDLYFTRQFPQN
jgi:5-formyltetrahydrofolate cyclo-ligase